MGGVVKSGKWGVFFVKSGPFLNAGCIMYSISIFLFYILLLWGCVRTHTHPLALYGPASKHFARDYVRSQHVDVNTSHTEITLQLPPSYILPFKDCLVQK